MNLQWLKKILFMASMAVCANTVLADDGVDSFTIYECVGDVTHTLVLSEPDGVAQISYFLDDEAVATVDASDTYFDGAMLFVPIYESWYGFGKNWVYGSNQTACQSLLTLEDTIDPLSAGINLAPDNLAQVIGFAP